jgi:hypothetical protein
MVFIFIIFVIYLIMVSIYEDCCYKDNIFLKFITFKILNSLTEFQIVNRDSRVRIETGCELEGPEAGVRVTVG